MRAWVSDHLWHVTGNQVFHIELCAQAGVWWWAVRILPPQLTVQLSPLNERSTLYVYASCRSYQQGGKSQRPGSHGERKGPYHPKKPAGLYGRNHPGFRRGSKSYSHHQLLEIKRTCRCVSSGPIQQGDGDTQEPD